MHIAKLAAVALAGLVCAVAFQASASAASPMTDGFIANVTANVAFLDRSSRLAADRAQVAATRNYARGTVREAVAVAETLTDVAPATRLAGSDGNGVITGRSVATVDPARKAANGRPALGSRDLDRLAAAKGKSFDDLYWQAQLDALSQIESDYRTYISHGDDPVLVTMARSELPKVMRRLTALTKI